MKVAPGSRCAALLLALAGCGGYTARIKQECGCGEVRKP